MAIRSALVRTGGSVLQVGSYKSPSTSTTIVRSSPSSSSSVSSVIEPPLLGLCSLVRRYVFFEFLGALVSTAATGPETARSVFIARRKLFQAIEDGNLKVIYMLSRSVYYLEQEHSF